MRHLMGMILAAVLISSPAAAVEHGNFMTGDYADGPAVTEACLQCHQEQGQDFIETAHWRWKGASPHVAGIQADKELGKRILMNNF
ncbi:MAG TPA: hypothetical protein VKN73_11395 [Desulfosalsimonadaceae bacterium]|nr:hypothetical protein [Desulfosalsimonadaceae bacterium]